jgi:hypothetical protein
LQFFITNTLNFLIFQNALQIAVLHHKHSQLPYISKRVAKLQFFITTVRTPHLNGKHTVFGQVTKVSELIIIGHFALVSVTLH